MIADTPESRELSPADALEAALDWWREAGVEDDYRNEATSWLAEPEQEQAVASPKPAKPPEEPKQTPLERAFEGTAGGDVIGGAPGALPETLEKFREWWMADKSLSHLGPERRLPPRGVEGAKLLVLVPEPMEGDADQLLSGAPGKFVEAILAAMGIAPHEAYLASALPAPLALPDWNDLSVRGLGTITRHHIALAAPHRVIAFGRSLAPLFDVPPEMAREPAVVKAGESTLPLLLAPELAELARSAPRRKNFWNRWLEWTA
ncbi:hypothetical protein [Qipengyuania sphaerica]|uniref:hypothetical protein n=1 Tax=Qipengyuania sphaerica TaxID=2867243 RepID=UPI001C86BDCD|nr:hypothetical protein [Qipengyuania sphaerica]MBX7540547.1 hypothetical protein [Qipengyuania sphaerica]